MAIPADQDRRQIGGHSRAGHRGLRLVGDLATGLGLRTDVCRAAVRGGGPVSVAQAKMGRRVCVPSWRSILGAVDGKDWDHDGQRSCERDGWSGEARDRTGAGGVSGATAQQVDPASLGAAFPRTHHILTLEFGDRQDFDDPRKEWRRLFSELLGTFALVLAAAGGGLLHAKGQISLAAAVVAPGLMVTAIILFMGAVSGAHLNPAVSLAFALRGDFPWKRVPGYIVIQLIGATLACLFLRWVFGNVEHLGATLPGPGYQNWQALLMEIVLTTLLVSVILGTASAAQNVGAIAALGVGGYIALAGLWAAPVSGVSMNPARSFGPALASGYWTSYWVYIVGPVAGALIAVGFAFVLRGRGGDVISRAAGSGVLDEGALAAEAKLSQDTEQGKAVPEGIAGTDTQQNGQ